MITHVLRRAVPRRVRSVAVGRLGCAERLPRRVEAGRAAFRFAVMTRARSRFARTRIFERPRSGSIPRKP